MEYMANLPGFQDELKPLLHSKEEAKVDQIQPLLYRTNEVIKKAEIGAVEIFDLLQGWMTQFEPDFALGTKEYTLADPLMTCMMFRIRGTSPKFFNA